MKQGAEGRGIFLREKSTTLRSAVGFIRPKWIAGTSAQLKSGPGAGAGKKASVRALLGDR